MFKGFTFQRLSKKNNDEPHDPKIRTMSLQKHFLLLTLQLPLKNANELIPTNGKNRLNFIHLFLSLGYLILNPLSIPHSFISVDNSELVAEHFRQDLVMP